MTERTLCIVKPDAVRKRVVGKILAMVEAGGLTPVAARIVRLAPGWVWHSTPPSSSAIPLLRHWSGIARHYCCSKPCPITEG